MHKIWVILKREFLERVRTRQFLIGTVLGPVLMAGFIVLPALLQRDSRPVRLVVVDAATGDFGAAVEQTLRLSTRNDRPDGDPRYDVSRVVAPIDRVDAVRDSVIAQVDITSEGAERIVGVVVVNERALATDTLEYYGSNAGSPSDMGQLSRTLRQAVLLEKLKRRGIDPLAMGVAVKPLQMHAVRVSRGAVTGESGQATFFLAYAMSFVLYMALLLYGVQVMTSTVEEKTNRINEILVSSVTPFQLLMGKVMGVGSVGLLQLGIWAGTAWGLTSQRTRIAALFGASPETASSIPIPTIPLEVLLVFLLFFVLGFFFYSAAYAAVGSSCNTVQETQQASMPVTLLIAAGLMMMFKLLKEPNGSLAQILSLVPPFAPFVTPVRNSLSPVPLPELLLSVAAMLLGVMAMAWVAGRIYRVGILMYGKKASLGEMLRWIRAR